MSRRLRPWMVPLRTTLDFVIFNGCYFLAFVVRFWGVPPYRNIEAYISVAPFIAFAAFVLMKTYGLDFTAKKRWADIFYSITSLIFIMFLFGMSVTYVLRGFAFPRTVFVIALFFQLVLFGTWRYIYWKLEKRDFGTKNVIIAGKYPDALSVAQKISASHKVYNVLGLLTESKADNPAEPGPCQVLGSLEEIGAVLNNMCPDLVIVCSTLSPEQKTSLVNVCLNNNVAVSLIPGLYEILLTESIIDQVDDIPVFELGNVSLSPWHGFVKKLMDLSLSFVGLLLFLPVLILIAFLVRLDTPGPIIYRQKRVGKDHRTFNLYKFRTMIRDAEMETGPTLAAKDDPRITRVGRFLRRYRLDELPQLFNVLKGDMSLVGPRPERPFFVEQFMEKIPDYGHRLQIKSGITGLAQIAGKYSTSPEDKLRYDLLYARTYSPLVDIKILFQTIKVLMIKDKAS